MKYAGRLGVPFSRILEFDAHSVEQVVTDVPMPQLYEFTARSAEAGVQLRKTIRVSQNDAVVNLALELTELFVVDVSDEALRPVNAAAVTLAQMLPDGSFRPIASGISAPSGTARVARPRARRNDPVYMPNKYRMVVDAPGYPPTEAEVAQIGPMSWYAAVRMSAIGSIAGRVVDVTGLPIVKANVRVVSTLRMTSGSAQPATNGLSLLTWAAVRGAYLGAVSKAGDDAFGGAFRDLKTSADGRFVATPLGDASTVTIITTAPGYTPSVIEKFPGRGKLCYDADCGDIVMRRPNPILDVSILDDSGAPVTGITFIIEAADLPVYAQLRSEPITVLSPGPIPSEFLELGKRYRISMAEPYWKLQGAPDFVASEHVKIALVRK